MTVAFEIDGQEFLALERRSRSFKFTEAVSLMVKCETQEEIDHLWESLSQGGEKGQCGWLKDKYGLSWQIVVPQWDEMLRDKDAARAERVMAAILSMTKPDLQCVQQGL
jgi:predicted 3-demethylubiquinone-9 3-methyltransferase (glyoxalase superfamily)